MPIPSAAQIAAEVALALSEDIGAGDITAQLIAHETIATAKLIAREAAVLCGTAWVDEIFRQLDDRVAVEWLLSDGDPLQDEDVVCYIKGPASSVLSGERAALNFLQTLSGTATRAATFCEAVASTSVRILDTRKTIPGLRLAQKYAVTCGGASNHRVGLYDAILIKENHIEAAGSIAASMQAAQQLGVNVEIEIEVENLDELQQALGAGAKRILLDNFDNNQLIDAVEINKGKARLEASGGVNLSTVLAIAKTGVDDISVGEITKDVKATDFSLRFI